MTLSAPYSQYSPGFARKTRFVYVSGASKPYMVCLLTQNGVDKFAYKPVDESDFTAAFVPVALGPVTSFGVMETSTPWQVGFLYSVNGQLKYMVVDFEDDMVILAPTDVTAGVSPALEKFETTILQIYLREQRLFGRFVGSAEGLLNDSSAYSVTDQDVTRKATTGRVRYAGAQVEQAELALNLGVDADTILLWHCWKAEEIDYAAYAYDTFGGIYNLTIYGLVRTDFPGQVGRSFRFPVCNQGYLLRDLGMATVSKSAAVSLWQYGGPDLPGNDSATLVDIGTVAEAPPVYESLARILFPTSSGLVTYQAGTDTISKSVSAGEYKGAWSHWLFQKVTGGQTIVRDFGSGKLKFDCAGSMPGLSVGVTVNITGTVNYDAPYIVTDVGTDWFAAVGAFVTDQGGNWSAGRMEIWRNGVLWHSGSGLSGVFQAQVYRIQMAYRWQGRLDDVAFLNHFSSPTEVAAIYARGLAGLSLSTSDTPGLYRYWKMDAPDTKVGIRDQAAESGYYGGAHLFTENLQPVVDIGIQFSTPSPLPFSWIVPASLTIEAKFLARCNNYVNYLLDGNLWLTYDFDGLLRFGFVDGNSVRHEFTEIVRAGSHVLVGEINHLALVHAWGDRESTKFLINGTEVLGKWRSGMVYTTGASGSIASFADAAGDLVLVTTTAAHGLSNGAVVKIAGTVNYDGVYIISDVASLTFKIVHAWDGNDAGTWNTSNVDHELAGGVDPQFANKAMFSTILLGDGDVLVGMKFSKVLKTPTQMRNFIRGRSA